MKPTRSYLAAGHSARDVYAWLDRLHVPMESKPFAIGVRVEHPQAVIDKAQYGGFAGHASLPPADYKLSVSTPDRRGVYTFCMCPGGTVINASSEAGRLNLNGMSLRARDGENANAALLVGVKPADFAGPLDGIRLQRQIEEAAYAMAGHYQAPCQRVEDFLQGKPSRGFGAVKPSYRPDAVPGDVAGLFPAFVADNLRYAPAAAWETDARLRSARRAAFGAGDPLLLARAGPARRTAGKPRARAVPAGRRRRLRGRHHLLCG